MCIIYQECQCQAAIWLCKVEISVENKTLEFLPDYTLHITIYNHCIIYLDYVRYRRAFILLYVHYIVLRNLKPIEYHVARTVKGIPKYG